MRKKILLFIIGLIVSVILLLVVLNNFNLREFANRIIGIKADEIVYFFLLIILLILIRGLRWGYISGLSISIKNILFLFKCISIGAFFNSIIPFGAGELYRINALKVRTKTGYGKATSTIVIERIIDMIFLFFLVIFISFFLPFPNWVNNLLFLVGSIIVIFICVLFFIRKNTIEKIIIKCNNKILKGILNFIKSFIIGFSDFRTSNRKIEIILSTLFYWFVSSWIVLVKGNMLNIILTPKVIFIIMALVNLSAIIPATPGMFGTYHAAVYTSLSIFGFSENDCQDYAVFSHLTNYVSMVLVGGILWFGQLIKILINRRNESTT
jgi:glycosyltransferase 2 family protein